MGREVRRVASDWTHPIGDDGQFQPLFSAQMPRWSLKEATHYQMYETTSPGTPISPVMPSAERLALWLVEHKASAFGDQTASYEAWLRVCQGAPAFSCALQNGKVVSGVAYGHHHPDGGDRQGRANPLAAPPLSRRARVRGSGSGPSRGRER